MHALDDVYRKFGDAEEAAQLLETELGNVLARHGVVEEDRAAELFRQIKSTLLVNLLQSLRPRISQSQI